MRIQLIITLVFCIYLSIGQNTTSLPGNFKIHSDSAKTIALNLKQNNVLFKERWITNDLFVYYNLTKNDITDTLHLDLTEDTSRFKLTWYGKLFFGYGMRWGKMHHGLDIYLEIGDTIYAAFDGIVRYSKFNEGGYGNCIIIRHLNGLETLYGHMSKLIASPNTYVYAGQPIGLGGSTGRSDGPHLHFETRYKDFSFDPYTIIDSKSQGLKTRRISILKKDLYSERYPITTSPTKIIKYSNRKSNALPSKSKQSIRKKTNIARKKIKSKHK